MFGELQSIASLAKYPANAPADTPPRATGRISIEKRLERLEKDLKKMRTPELEKEVDLLKRANAHLGTERPLREMEMTPEDKKRLRGFMFLSEKPILYVLNVG